MPAKRKPLKTLLDGYYTVKEAAEYLRCHYRSVSRFAENGTLPAINVEGRYFVRAEVLHNFLKPMWGNPAFGEIAKYRSRMAKQMQKRLDRAEKVRQARKLIW